MEPIKHGNLTIEFHSGFKRPDVDGDTLNIYTYVNNYDDFYKADLYLDDYIIQISTITKEPYANFDYKSHYFVLDMGVWNWRTYKDISVVKNLQRLNVHRIPKKDRHYLELDFGRTEAGTEQVELMSKTIQRDFHVLDGSASVKIRSWDHSDELTLTIYKSKLKIQTSTEQLERMVDVLFQHGFDTEANLLKSQLMKSLIETSNITIDLKERFRKRKKKKQ